MRGDTFGPKGDAWMNINYQMDIHPETYNVLQNYLSNKREIEYRKDGINLVAGFGNNGPNCATYTPRFTDKPNELKLLTFDEIRNRILEFSKKFEDLNDKAKFGAMIRGKLKNFDYVYVNLNNDMNWDVRVGLYSNSSAKSKYVIKDTVRGWDSEEDRRIFTDVEIDAFTPNDADMWEQKLAVILNDKTAKHSAMEILTEKAQAKSMRFLIENEDTKIFHITRDYHRTKAFSYTNGLNLLAQAQNIDPILDDLYREWKIAEEIANSEKQNEEWKKKASEERKKDKLARQKLIEEWKALKSTIPSDIKVLQ